MMTAKQALELSKEYSYMNEFTEKDIENLSAIENAINEAIRKGETSCSCNPYLITEKVGKYLLDNGYFVLMGLFKNAHISWGEI